MLTDDDIASIQQDFGTLAAKTPCTIKRGTRSGNSNRLGAPYNTIANHYCTILSLSQVKDAYLTSFSKQLVQATKNPRVILMGLPMPGGVDVVRGDYIVAGGQDFQVLDTDNTTTYAYQRVLFCQLVEGGAV